MKKYFYKGKLVRTSRSEKTDYKFILVDKDDNSTGSLSESKENLLRLKRNNINAYKRHLVLCEESAQKGESYPYSKEELIKDIDYWTNTEVNELDAVK